MEWKAIEGARKLVTERMGEWAITFGVWFVYILGFLVGLNLAIGVVESIYSMVSEDHLWRRILGLVAYCGILATMMVPTFWLLDKTVIKRMRNRSMEEIDKSMNRFKEAETESRRLIAKMTSMADQLEGFVYKDHDRDEGHFEETPES